MRVRVSCKLHLPAAASRLADRLCPCPVDHLVRVRVRVRARVRVRVKGEG